jgi:hypothetical protein
MRIATAVNLLIGRAAYETARRLYEAALAAQPAGFAPQNLGPAPALYRATGARAPLATFFKNLRVPSFGRTRDACTPANF